MPRGDKTGPMGQGARTGRGKGLCSGNDNAGYTNDEDRRGAGRRIGQGNSGRGRGRGMKGRGNF
ncbi:DUF5320 domain-containing protein [Marinilabilia salmonicolor]|uniref:DUF5320 domain-containing protein n=1 Tax=Marinilabilia salmonicolor TaxID=989 RepID=UPI00029A176B|nr:DUF5320 domain-containing protein [Marinilabilia salmonicolor]